MRFLRKLWGSDEERPMRGDTRVTYWRAPAAGWSWHCQDGNNEVVCASNQGYADEQSCLEGIENARDAMNCAKLVKRTIAAPQ